MEGRVRAHSGYEGGGDLSSNGWIGVDLDGTLAHYTGWQGETHIGTPIALMVERVKTWLSEGREVRIFTARVFVGGDDNRAASIESVREAIDRWSIEHIGIRLPITNIKDYGMIELWDDRAVQVEVNTGRPVGYSTRGLA